MAVLQSAWRNWQVGSRAIGIESARDPRNRFGITVSYWETEAAARSWKQVADHLEVQRLVAAKWYEAYQVRIATVGRAYGRRTSRDQDLSSDGA